MYTYPCSSRSALLATSATERAFFRESDLDFFLSFASSDPALAPEEPDAFFLVDALPPVFLLVVFFFLFVDFLDADFFFEVVFFLDFFFVGAFFPLPAFFFLVDFDADFFLEAVLFFFVFFDDEALAEVFLREVFAFVLRLPERADDALFLEVFFFVAVFFDLVLRFLATFGVPFPGGLFLDQRPSHGMTAICPGQIRP